MGSKDLSAIWDLGTVVCHRLGCMEHHPGTVVQLVTQSRPKYLFEIDYWRIKI